MDVLTLSSFSSIFKFWLSPVHGSRYVLPRSSDYSRIAVLTSSKNDPSEETGTFLLSRNAIDLEALAVVADTYFRNLRAFLCHASHLLRKRSERENRNLLAIPSAAGVLDSGCFSGGNHSAKTQYSTRKGPGPHRLYRTVSKRSFPCHVLL